MSCTTFHRPPPWRIGRTLFCFAFATAAGGLHALDGGAEIELFEARDDSFDPWDEIDARLDAERRTRSGD